MIHLYTGDGKGKTTAVIGLAVRAAGRDKRVIFAQFLKSGVTGELRSLAALNVDIIRSPLDLGFTFNMDEKTAALCREEEARILSAVQKKAEKTEDAAPDLIILDEVLDALAAGMIQEAALRGFVDQAGAQQTAFELALTGRAAPDWLAACADYISEVRKIKHPFDRGVRARIGIEK